MEKIRSFAKSQYIEKAELVFRFCYLCLVLLSFNTFSARQWYLFYISIFVVLFGFVLGILRLTHIKDYLTKNILVLVLFVVSYLVSSLTVIRYGFTENIQAIAWMCIQFFLLFAYDKTRENESVLDELKVYFNFFVAYTGLMALIGLVMMLFNWNTYRVVDNMYVIAGGFLWNRLWGCYIDPNYGAVFAIISIIISMYLWENSSNVKKIFLTLNMTFEFLYLCYSDSRTGLMAIFASSFIFVLCKTFENKPKKYFINVVTSIIIPIILVGSVLGVKSATSQIKMMVARNEMINAGVSEEIINAIEEANRIGRYDEEINQGDKSNNRFAIWDNAVDIYLENPIVGISFRNIMEYARAEMPEGFISTSGFESMHNSFVDVMVSQGTIGLMLLLILVAFSIIAFIKSFNSYLDYKYLIAIIAAIFASMMFYSETFYMNTGSAFLFWIILGYMINYRYNSVGVKL